MGSSRDYLIETVPDWVQLTHFEEEVFSFSAQTERDGGTKTRLYELTCSFDPNVRVQERGSGGLLPSSCPQRHINGDGSFCLALRAGKNINSQSAAVQWWDRLRLFILCQEVAHSSGRWPPNAQLSHGDAGEIELLARDVAEELGIRCEYEEALKFRAGALEARIQQYSMRKRAIKNGRAPCLCGRENKNGRARLRRECTKFPKKCLILLEVERRSKGAEFWKSFDNTTCCETMIDCPLRQK